MMGFTFLCLFKAKCFYFFLLVHILKTYIEAVFYRTQKLLLELLFLPTNLVGWHYYWLLFLDKEAKLRSSDFQDQVICGWQH